MTNIRIGTGYDVHQLKSNLPFLLGGIELNHSKGVVAHSDGDILFHALSDALLGAAALGDIGCLFSDTDSENKDIDSGIILSVVLNKILKLSYQILNIDVTIVLEKPKLQPIIPRIKKSVAESLKIELGPESLLLVISHTDKFMISSLDNNPKFKLVILK